MRIASFTGACCWVAISLGCGGSPADRDGARSPGNSSADLHSARHASNGSDPVAEAATTTTTTATLADSNDPPVQRLRQLDVPTPPGSAPSNTHASDPGRGPEDIRAMILARHGEARACYDESLRSHPGIEGDLVLQWTIDPRGGVTLVSLDTSRSQISEPGVVACIGALIKQLRFAQSPRGFETRASYSFKFHPRRPSGRSAGIGD